MPHFPNGFHNQSLAAPALKEPAPIVVEEGLFKNELKRSWVVQKFGGTSVGKCAEQIVEAIIKPALRENCVAVVCSARSSKTKSEGTTNR
jgi:hypothetical protein